MARMAVDIHPDALASLLNGEHGAPYQILGPQPCDEGAVSIRAFQPAMERMTVVDNTTGTRYEMTKERSEGLFEATVPGTPSDIRYHYEAQTKTGDNVSFA